MSAAESQLKTVLKDWGEYAEACRQFAQRVKGLAGVRAVAAKHGGDYVDLWVFADEAHRIELIRPIGEALQQVWKRFPQLLFDSFVTQQKIPADFIVLFQAPRSSRDHADAG
jgi:hypothetical protein